jgi:hypothetical protein
VVVEVEEVEWWLCMIMFEIKQIREERAGERLEQ